MRIKSFLLLLLLFFAGFSVYGHPNLNDGGCDIPDGLSAITNGTTADLTWNVPAGATGYWVEVESEGATPFYHVEVQVATNSYTATALTVNGNYKFKVRTKCGGDKSNWSDWHNFSSGSGGGGGAGGGGGSCDVPSGLAAGNIANGAATLTWTAVPGATGYWVEVESENFSPVFNVEVQVATNTYTVTGLNANVTYKFKVRTVCGGGQSDWSSWVFFTANGGSGGGNGGGGNGSCVVPSGLAAGNIANGAATLTWTAVPGATGYWVEVESENFSPVFNVEVQVATNTYTVTGLNANVTYKFKVRTVCGGGQSDWSSWVFFTANGGSGGGNGGGGNGSCAVPSGLVAGNIANGAATLTWTAVPGATGYWVEVESENFSPVFNMEVQVATNTYTVTGLNANVTYKFKVRTVCGGGQSDWSSWVFFTANGGSGGGNGGGGNGSCAVPSGLNVTNNTGGAASLNWTAVSGATGYWVEVESEGFTPPFHIEVFVNTNTYVVSGLVNNGTYKFKVRTACGSGQSDWSGWLFFVSGSGNAGGGGNGSGCQMPGTIMISNTTGTSATFTWSAVGGAIGYQLEIENASGNPTFFKDTATVTTTTYAVNNLLSGLNYKVKIRTLCANGSQSDWTNWLTFNSSTGQITPSSSSGGCGKPSGLGASSITTTTALLTWKSVPGALFYFVEIEKESGASQEIHLTTTDTFVNITGLVSGSLYKFKVRSQCSSGHSKWSSRKFFSTPLMKTQAVIGFAQNQSAQVVSQMTAYPNPVSNWLTVDMQDVSDDQPNYFLITDLSGKVVLEQTVTSDAGLLTQVFDLSNCHNGVYLLRWTNGQQSVTKKIMVSK